MNWRNLSIDFLQPQSVATVRVRDWDVQPGELVVVAGRSGIGKSTFLKTLCNLVRPAARRPGLLPFPYSTGLSYEGTVNSSAGNAPGVVPHYLSQDPAYLDGLSIFDNVRLLLAQMFAADSLRERLQVLLAELEVPHPLETPIELLSGGERQRVSLARCLLDEKSDFACLDEPFSQMDHRSRRKAIDLIHWQMLELGRSFLIVSHEVEDLLPFATSIIIFTEAGPKVTQATAYRLAHATHRADFPAEVLQSLPVLEGITLVEGGQNGGARGYRLSQHELEVVEAGATTGIEAFVLGPHPSNDHCMMLFVPGQNLPAKSGASVRPGSVAMPGHPGARRGDRLKLRSKGGHF